MPYNFRFTTDTNEQTDYDLLIGKYYGNHFVDTMEECFFRNPIHERDDLYGGVPLDGIMTLHQYIIAVVGVYQICRDTHAKANLSSMFKYFHSKTLNYPDNDVREEMYDNKRCICYRNIDFYVALAIIWGAYFLLSIESEIFKDREDSRNLLYDFMIEESGLNKELFMQKHVLMFLYRQHFESTMRKVAQSINSEDKSTGQNEVHDLDYYINHPVYSKAYDSIMSFLGIVSMKDNVMFSDYDYEIIFNEAENCVNRVLNAKNPELEISRVYVDINKKYACKESKGQNHSVTVITSIYCIGCIIEMLFMVALYDLMPTKTERMMNALINLREFIENHENSYIYKNDEMWKLVAERIPPRSNRPRVEDLEIEIARLQNKLDSYKVGESDKEWKDMMERIVKPFEDKMLNVKFYEIPKVKCLTRIAQCELIFKLYTSPIPFKVALLHTIGFFDFTKQNNLFKSETSLLDTIAKALNIKQGNRELKGNVGVLKEVSKEDRTKFTALASLDMAKIFYDGLLKES